MTNNKNSTKEYTTIRLPRNLIKEVNDLIEHNKEFGFDSTREFVKESIRKNIIKYRSIQENNYQTIILEEQHDKNNFE